MKLSIKARVILPGLILSFTRGKLMSFLREAQAFIKEIEIGDLEKKAIGFVQEGNSTRWNDSSENDVDFQISPLMIDNIVECFEAADAMKVLTFEHLPIYDQFVEARKTCGLADRDLVEAK